MQHLLNQFNSTPMIVLLVVIAVGALCFVSLTISERLEHRRRVRRGERERYVIRLERLTGR